MKITHPTWILALLGLLVSQVMAFPSEMQSNDENILQDVLNQYIKPYVEPVMDRVKDSPLYTSFTNMMDNVTEAKDKALYNLDHDGQCERNREPDLIKSGYAFYCGCMDTNRVAECKEKVRTNI